jgi:hypothetical protein
MLRRLAVVLACAVVVASPAAAASLAELLAAVSRNARFPEPTRADVTIERKNADGTTVKGAAVLLGNRRTLYVETPEGQRALVRTSKIVVRSGTRGVRAPVGTRLGATDLLLEDFVPLGPWTLAVPQVSDEGPTGTVVTGAPAYPSMRALIVFTVDPADAVSVRTKYFERSISDLAAFRRDETFADVGGHQRVTRIVVDRPRDDTSTRLDLTWRTAPETDRGLFGPRGLRAASPIVW